MPNTAATERRERLQAAEKCLGCEEPLGETRSFRGLCGTCYRGARYRLRKGQVTEAELVEDGYLLPGRSAGPVPANSFTRMLAERARRRAGAGA